MSPENSKNILFLLGIFSLHSKYLEYILRVIPKPLESKLIRDLRIRNDKVINFDITLKKSNYYYSSLIC